MSIKYTCDLCKKETTDENEMRKFVSIASSDSYRKNLSEIRFYENWSDDFCSSCVDKIRILISQFASGKVKLAD